MKKNFFSRNICKKCGQKQENCCTYYVPLLTSDINRIIKQGYDLKKFAKVSFYTKTELSGEEKWWQESMIFVGKRPYRLTTNLGKNNKCFFLKDGQGCLLGKNRPVECKIFPFWIEDKKIVYQDKDCLLASCKTTITKALKIIGETEKSVKKYFQMIKKDFTKNKKIHQRIIKQLIKK